MMSLGFVPEVSVIIPCYNGASTIGLQLEALRQQSGAPPFEVIVVDNGSTDSLIDSLRPFYKIPEFSLRCVVADAQRGSSFARNAGIAHAHSKLLQFCDADDVVGEKWVDYGARNTRECALWTGGCIPLPSQAFENGVAQVRERFDHVNAWEHPQPVPDTDRPVLMGGNFGAQRAVLLALGGFDQAAAHYGDDNDLALRARLKGVTLYGSGDTPVGYRQRDSARSSFRSAFKEMEAKELLRSRYPRAELSGAGCWPREFLRAVAATLRAVPAVGGSTTTRELLERWGWALGSMSASLRRRRGQRATSETLGAGLDLRHSWEVLLD